MDPLLEILAADYLHDYVIRITFNTNETVDVDLSPMIFEDTRGIFESLKQIEFFKQFRVDYTLCWGNEIDVAPEYLYFLAYSDDSRYEKLFKEWGYIK